jgi:hypothetical protein
VQERLFDEVVEAPAEIVAEPYIADSGGGR